MATRIPINKDNFDFDDGRDSIWDRMERDMERRRKEWEGEIDRMRQDFFHMRPEDRNYDAMSDRLMRRLADPGQRDEVTSAIETDASGRPVFRVRFDVHDYRPEEVHVKTDAHKVLVYAKHEEKGGSASVSREFSREVNIPREIDPLDLQCIMGQDGILTLEAPLPTPGYAAVREAPGSHPERLPPHQERATPPHHQAPETKVSSVSFQTGPAPATPIVPLAVPPLASMPTPTPNSSQLLLQLPCPRPSQHGRLIWDVHHLLQQVPVRCPHALLRSRRRHVFFPAAAAAGAATVLHPAQARSYLAVQLGQHVGARLHRQGLQVQAGHRHRGLCP